MATYKNTAEWYEVANMMLGCICHTCQTGKDNLTLYNDYCPHADSLVIEKENDWTAEIQGRKPTGNFRCTFYAPLKEETDMAQPNPNYTPPAFRATHDVANHPSHYPTGGIKCIDYIQEKLTPEEFRGYIKGNVIKYLTREQQKNGDEDIRKAQWYLNRLADAINGRPKKEDTENEETHNS